MNCINDESDSNDGHQFGYLLILWWGVHNEHSHFIHCNTEHTSHGKCLVLVNDLHIQLLGRNLRAVIWALGRLSYYLCASHSICHYPDHHRIETCIMSQCVSILFLFEDWFMNNGYIELGRSLCIFFGKDVVGWFSHCNICLRVHDGSSFSRSLDPPSFCIFETEISIEMVDGRWVITAIHSPLYVKNTIKLSLLPIWLTWNRSLVDGILAFHEFSLVLLPYSMLSIMTQTHFFLAFEVSSQMVHFQWFVSRIPYITEFQKSICWFYDHYRLTTAIKTDKCQYSHNSMASPTIRKGLSNTMLPLIPLSDDINSY